MRLSSMNKAKTGPDLGYSAAVIEHFQNPRNVGRIENPDGLGRIVNPVCGDVTELYLKVRDGVVEAATFQSLGCAVTIASASVFTEKIKGRKISELLAGKDEEVVGRLVGLIEGELGELPQQKLHCPPATVQAFLEAIEKQTEKEGQTELAARVRALLPKVQGYYQRGAEKEPD